MRDQHDGRLQELARAGGGDLRPLLGERAFCGDLLDDEDFVVRLQEVLEQLESDGVRSTLSAWVAATGTAPAGPDTDADESLRA